RVADVHDPGSRKRCELADGVADHVVGLDSPQAQRDEDREARGDERRLLDLGVLELLERRVEAKPAEIETGRGAPHLVDLHRLRDGLGDVPAHPGLERALAGEAERDLPAAAHPTPSALHSISAEPQVSPAPIPVISTRSPFRTNPSANASASARGTEPEEVLPYLSTFTITRSLGTPSFWTACSMIRTFAWWGT